MALDTVLRLTNLMRGRPEGDVLAERIDALLPQTQCRQCGYAGCRPYAEAIARGEADINQCPPGGQPGIRALARLLGRDPKPLNPEHGAEKAEDTVACIDEDLCIGCTKCIQACPVDAIVGAPRQMHTVLRDPCTGCELCVAPCPVDCIHMVPRESSRPGRPYPFPEIRTRRDRRRRADDARERYRFRLERLERDRREREERRRNRAGLRGGRGAKVSDQEKKAAIAAALAKARERQRQRQATRGAPGNAGHGRGGSGNAE